MKYKNVIMLVSCFLIVTTSGVCGSLKLGKSGYKFNLNSKKVVPNHHPYGLNHNVPATSAVGKKNCSKLKSICNDLKFSYNCEYVEWQHTARSWKKDTWMKIVPKEVECACKGVKLLPY